MADIISRFKEKDKILFAEVDKLKSGNVESFNTIYDLSKNYIYKIIWDIVRNQDATDDIMQETYIQIYNKITTLADSSAFYSWAGRIATNYSLTWLKKENRYVLAGTDESGEAEDFIFERASDDQELMIPENVLLEKEKQQIIADIIDSLSVDQKLCVQYYYFEDMSVKEIAAQMETSEGTIKSRLNYARKSIKTAVEGFEKKQGTKLYSLGSIPLLYLVLRQNADFLFGGTAVAATTTASTAGAAGAGIVGTAATGAGTTANSALAAGVSTATAGTATTAGGATTAGTAVAATAGKSLAIKVAAGVLITGAAAGGTAVYLHNSTEKVTASISDWSYEEKVSYISDDYMMAKEDDTYYIIDNNGEKISDDKLPDGMTNAFEYVNLDQDDGCFIVMEQDEDGYFKSAILDKDLGCVYSCGTHSTALFYVTDYRDGLIFAEEYSYDDRFNRTSDTTSVRASGIITQDGDGYKFSPTRFKKDKIAVYNSSNGYIIAGLSRYDEERECFCFSKDSSIEVSQLESGENITYSKDEIRIPEYNGHPIVFNNNLPDKDGWLSSMELTGERIENGDGTWSMNAKSAGFYNIKNGEYVESPEEVLSTSYFQNYNGCEKCTVADGRALGKVEQVSDDLSYYKILDVSTGEYASDEKYISADIAYHDLLLVENTDEKWGYIKYDDLSHTGEWYDGASAFCNGYAVVIKDGKGWIINEKFEKVSDEFEAESAYAIHDYITTSDLNGESVFFVKQGGKYHKLTIDKEEP